MATFLLYLSDSEKIELAKVSKKTGISVSRLLLKAWSYWLSNNPLEGLQEEAERFKGMMEEREAKQRERETGDYIGSFKKEKDKINRIAREYLDHKISHDEYQKLLKQTKDNYTTTRRKARIRLGISSRNDRFEEFKENHSEFFERYEHGKHKKKKGKT